MHIRVQSVQLDAGRTCWTRNGLRIGVLGDQNDHWHPIDRSPRRGVFDVLIDGSPVSVRPGSVLPPPILIDGHLVAPIVRPPDDRLALDVDEAERPITRSWRPKPADLRCERTTPDGLGIALDLELTATNDDHRPGYGYAPDQDPDGSGALDVELLLQRAAREHTVPASLVPGPGTVGRLRADLPSEVLRPGDNWMLSLRTPRGVGRLGVDLAVSAAGQPYARPTTAVTVVIVLAPAEAQRSHGRQIGDCIGSALDQTLPREHYEVLVVDQGCGDGTAGLLDWLATLHPRLRVLHLAPARDADTVVRRGISAARGEFVYFLHPAERLTPNALRDLLAYARLHDADIVAGRTVRSGRTLAPTTFRTSRPYATIRGADLARSLTPDKLFRTSLLDRHRLSFGPDRLDRQRFVAEAYLVADRVAVFADRVCCRRPDAGDLDDEPVLAPDQHVAGVRAAVAALTRRTEPGGGTHIRFLRHWYRTEVLHRLRAEALLGLPPGQRAAWVRELAALAFQHFDPVLAHGLSPADQIVARVLAAEATARTADDGPASDPPANGATAGALSALVALAEWERTLDARAEVRWLRPTRRGLAISARITLHGHGAPAFRSIRQDGNSQVTLDPPLRATPPGCAPDPRSVRRHLDNTRIELLAESPEGNTLGARARSVRFDGSEFRVWAEIPTVGVPGGRYRLDVRMRCCGWTRTAPVRAAADVLARQRRLHPPVPHVGYGPIAIDVPPHGGRPYAALCTDRPRLGLTSGLRTVLRTLGSG